MGETPIEAIRRKLAEAEWSLSHRRQRKNELLGDLEAVNKEEAQLVTDVQNLREQLERERQ